MNFYVNKYKYLLIEINNGIATIVLNRPKSLNSANMRLHWEMGEIWKDLDEDKNVKVIIVTGSGKAFSVGGDFEMVENMTKDVTVLYQVNKFLN